MKWFKLDSDFHNDDRVQDILEDKKLGPHGLVVWLFLMSCIAEKWNGESLDQEFEISKKRFRKICKKQQKVLESFLEVLGKKFEILWKTSEEYFIFRYPKFLKKQESYFRGVVRRDDRRYRRDRKIDNKIIINKKNKTKNGFYFAEAKRVIDFLNKEAGRNFHYTKTTMKFVEARLKELISERHCSIEEAGDFMRMVVSLKKQNPFFVEKGLLRPSTLYNQTKFNEYLEEVETYEKNRKQGNQKV